MSIAPATSTIPALDLRILATRLLSEGANPWAVAQAVRIYGTMQGEANQPVSVIVH